jgi:dihydrofolate synthase/folylpolyglutamate synthase
LEAAGFRLPALVLAEGLSRTEWPARFQELPGGRIVIDGAHNPHGAASTVKTWRQAFGKEKATVIFGTVAAKDYAASLDLLAEVADRFYFVTLQSPRALPAAVLALSAPHGAETAVFASLARALEAAESLSGRCLVCGSLYLCGEALALKESGCFEPSAQ